MVIVMLMTIIEIHQGIQSQSLRWFLKSNMIEQSNASPLKIGLELTCKKIWNGLSTWELAERICYWDVVANMAVKWTYENMRIYGQNFNATKKGAPTITSHLNRPTLQKIIISYYTESLKHYYVTFEIFQPTLSRGYDFRNKSMTVYTQMPIEIRHSKYVNASDRFKWLGAELFGRRMSKFHQKADKNIIFWVCIFWQMALLSELRRSLEQITCTTNETSFFMPSSYVPYSRAY